ncbi:putative art-4 protein [Eremomyces bilateralis CBS 781.70]|uniref:20S-pre-rRNA D-site endonuclease NOB1 n=1 Tax=Eremomyces bilateralis CBS 781.70 TaxID=1392243 RepID=A0A6G1G752_9PEZI|nr:putative art-4 protein [Eremomyces bilateralis CBS 781.70]KAF1813907.1 putative art-4 protein [Eremomyces bilateralis CBS 781.70]
MDPRKIAHTLILDAGPIIKNEPSVSSLLAQGESLVTTPTIISELRDEATRTRVETTLLPFLTLRSPKPSSIKFVTEFARKTGDAVVLSKPDIELIALAYDVECERNGGDWRLRNAPGQKGLNGSPPQADTSAAQDSGDGNASEDVQSSQQDAGDGNASDSVQASQQDAAGGPDVQPEEPSEPTTQIEPEIEDKDAQELEESVQEQTLDSLAKLEIDATNPEQESVVGGSGDAVANPTPETKEEDDDSDGWITPANISKHRAKDLQSSSKEGASRKPVQAAIITSDFAMQNVILSMNLNLLSASLQRVRQIKTFILRCHACFLQTKDMTKQFCPRCGGPTLTRVSCSTNQNGEFKIFLKKNMQWNTRGDRYSIPKPVAGSSKGKIAQGSKGGGKGGWGQGLILAEDQKEYTRAMEQEKRRRQRDLMDEDYLPSILSGERSKSGGKPRIGAGKNVNSKKRI